MGATALLIPRSHHHDRNERLSLPSTIEVRPSSSIHGQSGSYVRPDILSEKVILCRRVTLKESQESGILPNRT